MIIEIPVEYVMGHLRYGHYVTEINENVQEIKNLIDKLNNSKGEGLTKEEDRLLDEILDKSNFVIDDYEIDDIGPVDWWGGVDYILMEEEKNAGID